MPPPLRLAIAACHRAVADALSRRLAAEGDGMVDAVCVGSPAELDAALRGGGARIALLDGGVAGADALPPLAAIRAADRRQPVVVLVGRCDTDAELALARAGAWAAAAWSAPTGALLRLLRIVAAGSTAMSTAALLAGMPPRATAPSAAPPPMVPDRLVAPLTERETIILARVRRGESNRVIGDALGLDENRIKILLRTIFRKTGARNRTEAALRAAAGAALVLPTTATDRPAAA
jgi:DNA-binding NarL/FixJ family response regulator